MEYSGIDRVYRKYEIDGKDIMKRIIRNRI